MTRIKIKHVN